jgi:hypothetical protein
MVGASDESRQQVSITPPQNLNLMRCYVIVHGGAGEHSKNSEPEVKKALRL